MATKDPRPDDKFGPKLADLMLELAEAVSTESGATSVYVSAQYVFTKGSKDRGKMKLDIKVSPDAKKERLSRDGSRSSRGTELKRRVEEMLRKHSERLRKEGGK